MNKYILGLELLITTLYIKNIVESLSINIYQGISFLLIYLCLKLVYYIVQNKPIKKIVSLTSLLFLMVSVILTSVPLEYFLLINSIQLFSSFPLLGISFCLYYFNVLKDIQNEFLIISLLVAFIYQALSIYDGHKVSLEKKLSQLEEAHTQLNIKTQLNELYETNTTYTTRLEERQLITQQLHDELGHVLSGNTMQLEAALLILEKDQEKAHKMIHQVIINLRHGTESIRHILKEIQPNKTVISIENIKKIALETEDSSGIKVNLYYDHLIADITYNQWQLILVNIKEALTNMMKYSKASKCDIIFERLNYQYKICIKDNGVGQNNIIKGMGLQGIQERTIDVGGQVIFDGSQGFSITMLLSLKKGI